MWIWIWRRKNYCSELNKCFFNLQGCVAVSEGGCYALKGLLTSTKSAESTTAKLEMTTPPICLPTDFGNVPDPTDCTKYYLCSAGMAISLTCIVGHEFDPTIRVSSILSHRRIITLVCLADNVKPDKEATWYY